MLAKFGQSSVSITKIASGLNLLSIFLTQNGTSNGKYVIKSQVSPSFLCAISCPVFVPVRRIISICGKVSLVFLIKFSTALTSPTETA